MSCAFISSQFLNASIHCFSEAFKYWVNSLLHAALHTRPSSSPGSGPGESTCIAAKEPLQAIPSQSRCHPEGLEHWWHMVSWWAYGGQSWVRNTVRAWTWCDMMWDLRIYFWQKACSQLCHTNTRCDDRIRWYWCYSEHSSSMQVRNCSKVAAISRMRKEVQQPEYPWFHHRWRIAREMHVSIMETTTTLGWCMQAWLCKQLIVGWCHASDTAWKSVGKHHPSIWIA